MPALFKTNLQLLERPQVEEYAKKISFIIEKFLKTYTKYNIDEKHNLVFSGVTQETLEGIIRIFNRISSPVRRPDSQQETETIYHLDHVHIIYRNDTWFQTKLLNTNILFITAIDENFMNDTYNQINPQTTDTASLISLNKEEKKYAKYYMRKHAKQLMTESSFNGLDNEESLIYFLFDSKTSEVKVKIFSSDTDEKGLILLSSEKISLRSFKKFANLGKPFYQEKVSDLLQSEDEIKNYLLKNASLLRVQHKYNGLGSPLTELVFEYFDDDKMDIIVKIVDGDAEISRTRTNIKDLIELVYSQKSSSSYADFLTVLQKNEKYVETLDPDLIEFTPIEDVADKENELTVPPIEHGTHSGESLHSPLSSCTF